MSDMPPLPPDENPVAKRVTPQVVDVTYQFAPVPMNNGAVLLAFRMDLPTGMCVTFWGPKALQRLADEAHDSAEAVINNAGLAVVKDQLWKPNGTG